jgi:hypothetical protein
MLGMYSTPILQCTRQMLLTVEIKEEQGTRAADVKVIGPTDASLKPGNGATTVVLTPVYASSA